MAGSRCKFAFEDIAKTNGRLLTIHQTVTEDGQKKRIQFIRCDFSPTGDSFVAVDHRGSIFLFNVARQFYAILPERVARCSCIKFHPQRRTDLIAGTKDGTLILMEYNVAGSTTPTNDGWSTAATEGIVEPQQQQPSQLLFGAPSPVTAKIKLRTQPYPRGGNPIINLSFPTSATNGISPAASSTLISPHQSSPSNAFLSTTPSQCIVHDLITFEELSHVDTMDCLTLKQAMYLPPFDYVLLGICGDDSIRVWGMEIPSATTLGPEDDQENRSGSEFRRRFAVVAMREEFLLRHKAQAVTMTLKRSSSSENLIESLKKDFSKGHLTAIACSRDSRRVIVATLDSTLVLFATNDGDFSVDRVLRLANEVFITKIEFLMSELPEADLVICRTNVGDLVLLDLMTAAEEPAGNKKSNFLPVIPFLVVEGNCVDFAFSSNYKLFAVQTTMGEMNLYSLEFVLRRMETELAKRDALKGAGKKKAANLTNYQVESAQKEIQSLLPTKRLVAILNEYNEYPQRQIVWRSLLKLPQNEQAFCELLRKGYHPCVKTYDKDFPLKSRAALRNLKKIVSCLACWSPAFASCDFVPHFVFPFLKVHEKNILFTFEVCAAVLLNHGQLLFEFAPLEPFNYLGMIENLIAHYDPKLMEFYMRRKISSKTFAWSIVKTAFAEVLDTEQWLQLWDHLITNAADFMVFAAVSYNMTQRPVIMRLESASEIETFFRDQNLIDMKRFLRTAYTLATQCPDSLKPRQYIRPFVPLLSPVYQKFYNYPREIVDRSVAERERRAAERDALQEKMEAVATAENRMMDQLNRQLADEEHSKRLAEVERALDEVMVHEALETANQHHMAVLVEREQRNRELATAADLNMCLVRKRTQEREQELERLLRTVDRERIAEEMELQLCEERRQMLDVERKVTERLTDAVPLLSTKPQQTKLKQPPSTRAVSGAVGRNQRHVTVTVPTTRDCKGNRPPVATNRDKLIKYADRFQRISTE